MTPKLSRLSRIIVAAWPKGSDSMAISRFPGTPASIRDAKLRAAPDNHERWNGRAFGNPRLPHFHTRGARAPGEIAWNVVDPSIIADGLAAWKDGAPKRNIGP